MMEISCIALDDEPLALELLSKFIQQVDFLDLKYAFSSAPKALQYLSENEIECIFLDIEMPEINGIELAKTINQSTIKPEVVFVSSYGKYAIDGFKLEATDFLLKPYSAQEVLNAAQKVKRNIELRKLASKSQSENGSFFIKVDAQQIKLEYSDIIFAESMRDYVKIYTENRDVPYIPLITLKRVNELLPSENFYKSTVRKLLISPKFHPTEKAILQWETGSLRLPISSGRILKELKIRSINKTKNPTLLWDFCDPDGT